MIKSTDHCSEDEHLSDFFRKIGCHVAQLDSGLWWSRGARIFEPVLMKGPTAISDSEISSLWKGGCLFLRYPAALDQIGIPSYIYLVDDSNYDLDSLPHKQRKETKRSLRLSHVERIPISYIIKNGMDLIPDTYSRQRRFVDDSIISWWKKYFEFADCNILFEAWGAFVGKELAAFRLDFTYRGGFYGEALFNRQDLLKYQVMNALMFVSTRDVIRRPEIDHVSYGIRGIFGDAPSLNRFKESMGYRKIDILERIEVAPIVKPLLMSKSCVNVIQRVLRKYSKKFDKPKRIIAILDDILELRRIMRKVNCNRIPERD